MIKVSIFYPFKEGNRFDLDYYFNKHMPMSIELLSPALRGATVDQGLRIEVPGLQTPFIAMAHLIFDSFEAFRTQFSRHAEVLTADISNYTDVEPVIQISEVRIAK